MKATTITSKLDVVGNPNPSLPRASPRAFALVIMGLFVFCLFIRP